MRFPFFTIFLIVVPLAFGAQAPVPHEKLASPQLARAIHNALGGTSGAAVVLDIPTNHVLAIENPDLAAKSHSTPGSSLKPFFLLAALDSGAVSASDRVHCSRSLHIAGRAMNCSHPEIAHPLDAREALAYSCNTWFAELAARLYTRTGGENLAGILRSRGIDQPPALLPSAAPGSVAVPHSVTEAQLLVLGVQGVHLSPLAMAAAYRSLALELTSPHPTAAAQLVAAGLSDSVSFGMADTASVDGLAIAGKTGTASPGEGLPAHGWFAGYAPAYKPRVVVVVFLPVGRGADAAACAQKIFTAWSLSSIASQSGQSGTPR